MINHAPSLKSTHGLKNHKNSFVFLELICNFLHINSFLLIYKTLTRKDLDIFWFSYKWIFISIPSLFLTINVVLEIFDTCFHTKNLIGSCVCIKIINFKAFKLKMNKWINNIKWERKQIFKGIFYVHTTHKTIPILSISIGSFTYIYGSSPWLKSSLSLWELALILKF